MEAKIKTLNVCRILFTVLIYINLVALLLVSIKRCSDNLWPNIEVWIDDNNKKEVEEFVDSLNLPTEDIERVVYVEGLGDGEVVVHYKRTVRTTGWIKNGAGEIFTKYGENEGTRATIRGYVILLVIFAVAILGKNYSKQRIEELSSQ